MESDLLNEIREFLKSSEMGPSYFGKVSCGNSNLLRNLESGGSVTLRTAARIRAFIAERNEEFNTARVPPHSAPTSPAGGSSLPAGHLLQSAKAPPR